jgi:hypothetical protein
MKTRIIPRRNVDKEIAALMKRKVQTIPEFTGKSWDEVQMSAAIQYVDQAWLACLKDIAILYSVLAPPQDAWQIKQNARADAIRRIAAITLALDEMSTELKAEQALAAANGDGQ